MIGIVTTMGSQIEGDRQTLLSGSQILLVEGVGGLSGGESSVLTNGPGLLRVHGGVRTTSEREDSGSILGLDVRNITLLEQRLHDNALRGLEAQSVYNQTQSSHTTGRGTLQLLGRKLDPGLRISSIGESADGRLGQLSSDSEHFYVGSKNKVFTIAMYVENPLWRKIM